MEKLKLPEDLKRKMTFHSDVCEEHVKPVQKMVINGEVKCPRCESEKWNRLLEIEMQNRYEEIKRDELYNTLLHKSIIEDETLLKARIYNFLTHGEEESKNKHTVQKAIKRYLDGEVFNLILQGNPGTGKSHLAYAVLHELNETKKYSCLFISVEAMLRKIKASFNNKESRYTEEYFNRLLSEVDFLVLDDLGAETGAINTEKSATDFVQRVLYGIATVRQNKSTILTTNLPSDVLFNMYDKKLVSRLLKNPEFVLFKVTKDKRINKLPF